MRGLSRWAGTGGRYRTVQRFCATVLPWATLLWVLLRHPLYRPDAVYLLVGDEVVATKAGTQTQGRDRLFARLYGQPVPGLAFFALSLLSPQHRRSVPIGVEQGIRSDAKKAARKAKAAAKHQAASHTKRRPGRPTGSKNTPKVAAPLTPKLLRITGMLGTWRPMTAGVVSLTSVGRDGHCGHHNALAMAQEHHFHLLATLRHDAALSFPYPGPSAGRGPRRTYGDKVRYDNIPRPYLQETTVEGGIQTCGYQAPMLHQEFVQPFNVVILVKTNRRTRAQAQAVLFSRDLTLAAASLVAYDSLRFQSACNVRDAKPYWGREDFMHVTATGVTNAANLALCMVNVAYCLQARGRQQDSDYSMLDLQADWRGYKYVEETITR